MNRVKILVLMAVFFCGRTFADDITVSQAWTVAENFIAKDSIGQSVLPDRTVDTVMKRGGFYLVTLKPTGHIFVSVNRSARPIPTFSDCDFIEPQPGSPQEALLAIAETNAINATGTQYETQWKTLLGEKRLRLLASSATSYVNVEPMVTTTWGQSYPYYELTPVVKGSHTLVGCVATAYVQIMRYWEWPAVLNEDIVTEHTAGNVWGYKWQLKAGTVFDWQDMPISYGSDYPTRLKLARGSMFAGMLAKMKYNVSASGTQTSQPGINDWYTPYTCLDTSNSTQEERNAGMKKSLQEGCPFMVSIDTEAGSHAVVGDGWKEDANGAYVRLNYGWQESSIIYYDPASPLGVYLYQKPNPMVQNKPMAVSSTLPVKIEWAFPSKGYADTLSGFDIVYREVEETAADWTDDMSVGKGTIEGACISVEMVDGTDHGNVLRIGTKADNETYTWPTMVATENTVFSYDIHSYNALGMSIQIQLLDPTVGWTTIETPKLGTNSEIAWTRHSLDLGAYAGRGIAIRVKATTSGATSYNDDEARSTGVQFDNLKLTNVRQANAAVAGQVTAGKDARALDVTGSLVSGKTYLFQVTPTFIDANITGIPGYQTSCKIVDVSVQKPTITSIESVVESAPAVQSGMYRSCYLGRNQFGVYCSEATTHLEASLSHLAVTSEVQVPDAAFPGEFVTDYKCVSTTNAVTVVQKDGENGKFLVTVNFTNLTTYAKNTGMILTLVARNDEGDAYQKDVYLMLTDTGNEPKIDVADLPESGTISGGGGTTPSEPTTVYCSVSFATMGGTTVSQRSIEKGKAVGVLPETARDGFTFLGWFTEISGGTRVTKDILITANVIYFAQWQENTPAVTTYTVTFDPNGGSPEMSRFVNENAAVGTLPTTVTKSGYKLVGWFTAANGGMQIDATQVIAGNVTYYAHWEVSSGGGDTPGGGADDDGSTRFCHGVTKTSGYFDVHRSGSYNTLPPISYDLIYWWVNRYYEANGKNPSDYVAPNESNMATSDSGLDIAGYTATMLNSSLKTTLPAGTERTKYFPSDNTTAASWIGSVQGNDRAVQVGRCIYAALANGPIGFKAHTSNQKFYCGVIWGCDYSSDDKGKYATKLWVTDTRSKNDGIKAFTFTNCSNSYGDLPGLKDFNSSGSHGVIEYYYPITGVVVTKPETPVTTYTVTFLSDGGSAVNSIQVEKDSTIATLPTTVKSGYVFQGWFNGDTQLTTTTTITADVTYTARWIENVVTPTVYTIVFDANGGNVDELSREVPCDASVGALPTPTYAGHIFTGWYLGETLIEEDTIVEDSAVYVAHWTVLKPTDDDPIGVADNSSNPGKNYTSSYGYEMYDNYWTARKRAIQEGRQFFILSGAAWCSNCSFVKNYLTSLGTGFSDRFVVYYSDNDSTTCNYFKGGLPQYGAADPRTVDAFTGTLNGNVRSWDIAWQTETSGIYQQDRGGYASERVDLVLTKGKEHPLYNGLPTNLVIRGLSTLGTGTTGHYELVAQFDDGTEMPVDYGVDWEVVSGDGSFSDACIDGRDVGALKIRSGAVVIRARSKFYFTGTKTMTVDCAPETDIVSVEILTSEVNLEDNATPTLEAEATLTNGKKIQVIGFGTWTATFDHRIERTDPELEENSETALKPTITIDNESRLNYALSANGLLEVCDQVINITLTVNGKSDTKAVTVWGPTKVIPSKWTMVSGPKQTTPGVVRLNCTELKYNYGGQIRKTSDTYFASYETVLKTGIYSQTSKLRGLTVYVNDPNTDRDYKVALRATKVNGKYKGYLPADPESSPLATNVSCLARGSFRTTIEKGLVPDGFFCAFFPGRSDYETLADLDSDGDGFKNWEEYVLGTDPTNASDAFTLMQGYQHLTAPAANGATMQYKVMYQQRAGRVYYIDAKKAWNDDWTHVATVNLATMEAANVTTFTDLNPTFADEGAFFRVRAALNEHVFSDPATAPVIVPNMLVANRGAVIDLSDGSRLDLSSFDTDATDPGTVYVKVPANIVKGTELITAPTVARSSLEACRPKDRTDIAFEVVESSGRLALRVAGDDAPFVKDGKGSIEIMDDQVIVTPNANETDITLVNVGERTVVIPSLIDRIVGVASERIVVKSGEYDVTDVMKFTETDSGFVISLDGTGARMFASGDEIPVTPVLSGVNEPDPPFVVEDSFVTVGIKTIPGLRYQLKTCVSLGDDWSPIGTPQTATEMRLRLKAERSMNPSAFYTISVMK